MPPLRRVLIFWPCVRLRPSALCGDNVFGPKALSPTNVFARISLSVSNKSVSLHSETDRIMEIEDLYINSDRLAASVALDFKRYLYTEIDWEDRLICIRGARGVGKTTMMLQYLKEHYAGSHAGLYVSLDDFFFTNHRLIDVAEYHYLHGGKVLLVDEVHHYPYKTWSMEIKNAYDRYPGLRIVFTGSSLLQVDSSAADLSRRCAFYDLIGLSFREYMDLNGVYKARPLALEDILSSHVEVAMEVIPHVKPLALFDEYLRHGYYPFYKDSPNTYYRRLQQVASIILDVDLPSVEKVEFTTIAKTKRLLAIIAQQVPFTVNLTSLGQSVETSRQMVNKLLGLLKRAALVNLLYSGRNVAGQLSKPEKVYIENTNMMYALSSDANVGNVRETFFCNQLSYKHELAFTGIGDFLVDNKYDFEVGGRNKKFMQIKDIPGSYIAADGIETGFGNKIPLWLFGMMY